MDTKELRFTSVEYREEGENLILEGYPIVWNERTLIGSDEHGFFESIDRKSLDKAQMKDVPLKYNHQDNTYILARTRNKSLDLKVDDKGLKMTARLQGNVQAHRDVYNMVQSGLLDKMSFAFNVTQQELERNDKLPHRKVLGIGRLFDVSIVDTPAYDGTSVFARSLDLVDTELKTLDNERQKQLSEDEEAKRKADVEKLKYSFLLEVNE